MGRSKALDHLEKGAPLETWCSDPFLALMGYLQLQRALGWEPFVAAFRDYIDVAPEDRATSDEEKREQFVLRFSHAAGRNLLGFFNAWGLVPSNGASVRLTEALGD